MADPSWDEICPATRGRGPCTCPGLPEPVSDSAPGRLTITRDQLAGALTRVRDTTALTVSPALADALWGVLGG